MSLHTAVRTFWAVLIACYANVGLSQTLLDPPPEGNDHAWDCWISTNPTEYIVSYMIRCIRDRDVNPNDPPADSIQSVLLDKIHDHIHNGETLELDMGIVRGRFDEVLSHVWRIRIHQYPYEESWRLEAPQMLVQNTLCRSTEACFIRMQR